MKSFFIRESMESSYLPLMRLRQLQKKLKAVICLSADARRFTAEDNSGIDSRNLRKRSKVRDCLARILIRDRTDRKAIIANEAVRVELVGFEFSGTRVIWKGQIK